MRCVGEDIGRLDARLSALAREETSLELRVGQALEVLGRGGFAALGFSSSSAYVLERCDRSARWAEVARCLARRVEGLPELRRAMAAGRISWSMAELVARVARPGDEAGWLEVAESRTVRQMRVLVAEAMARRAACAAGAVEDRDGHADGGEWVEGDVSGRDVSGRDDTGRGETTQGSEMVTLTCSVNQEEAWLFEATRSLLGLMGVRGADSECEALLAEGLGTLLETLPEGALDREPSNGRDVDRERSAQQRWARELARWRVEAEALCEGRFCGLLWSRASQRFRVEPVEGNLASEEAHPVERREATVTGAAAEAADPGSAVAIAAARGMASLMHMRWAELDRHVRELSRALAGYELEVSRLVLQFHRANGWRRPGYATEAQYARERLGWSVTSLRGRRSLALRLEELPGVAAALGAGQLGIEAALQVVRVATGSTEAAWVERARRRTVKHLREEVAAALVALRCSGEVGCLPPSDTEMEAFQQLEQAVVSGRVCHGEAAQVANDTCEADSRTSAPGMRLAEPSSPARRAWCVMLGSLATWLEGGLQLSAGVAGEASRAGRVTLRLRVSRSTCAWWRELKSRARRWLPHGMSWLGFLCLSMWQAWRHLLGPRVAYSQIYARDCQRCQSPVCSRRDVTPHHLRFRSAGGSDDPGNVSSVCTWCHLEGVHGGRIRATGTARLIHWEIGAGSPCVVVHGRERQVA